MVFLTALCSLGTFHFFLPPFPPEVHFSPPFGPATGPSNGLQPKSKFLTAQPAALLPCGFYFGFERDIAFVQDLFSADLWVTSPETNPCHAFSSST